MSHIALLTYRISYNHALPVLFPSQQGGKRTQYARELLDHPLSTLYDSRLVISVEMCEVRGEPATNTRTHAQNRHLGHTSRLQRRIRRRMMSCCARPILTVMICTSTGQNIMVRRPAWQALTLTEGVGLSPDHFLRVERKSSSRHAYTQSITRRPT